MRNKGHISHMALQTEEQVARVTTAPLHLGLAGQLTRVTQEMESAYWRKVARMGHTASCSSEWDLGRSLRGRDV